MDVREYDSEQVYNDLQDAINKLHIKTSKSMPPLEPLNRLNATVFKEEIDFDDTKVLSPDEMDEMTIEFYRGYPIKNKEVIVGRRHTYTVILVNSR